MADTSTTDSEPATQGIFDDFSGYRTATDEDYHSVFQTGLVTLDTNVLLDLYRQHSSASEQLFEAMERLGDRLWFSHQVLDEFHRNREGAIGEPADEAEKAVDDLSELRQKTLTRFRTWVLRVGLSSERERELRGQLETGYDALQQGIQEVVAEHDPDTAADTSTDPVLARLEQIVTGRRSEPMAAATYQQAVAEGKRRITARIPPGYRDAGKDKRPDAEGATGDYLVWEQFLVEAAARQVDGLFVTRDVKDDWFRSRNGQVLGPRNELAEEYHGRTGRRLFLLRAASWMHHMKPLLTDASAPSAESAQIDATVRALDRPTTEQRSGGLGWTRTSVQRLIDELRPSYPVQSRAIQQAYRDGGYVTREEVYALAGYSPDRSLRGFTRPIERLTRMLEEEGLLPYYAEAALSPRYDFAATGNNRAVGFELSEDFRAVYAVVFGDGEESDGRIG